MCACAWERSSTTRGVERLVWIKGGDVTSCAHTIYSSVGRGWADAVTGIVHMACATCGHRLQFRWTETRQWRVESGEKRRETPRGLECGTDTCGQSDRAVGVRFGKTCIEKNARHCHPRHTHTHTHHHHHTLGLFVVCAHPARSRSRAPGPPAPRNPPY